VVIIPHLVRDLLSIQFGSTILFIGRTTCRADIARVVRLLFIIHLMKEIVSTSSPDKILQSAKGNDQINLARIRIFWRFGQYLKSFV